MHGLGDSLGRLVKPAYLFNARMSPFASCGIAAASSLRRHDRVARVAVSRYRKGALPVDRSGGTWTAHQRGAITRADWTTSRQRRS
jgi:hypothetical protein